MIMKQTMQHTRHRLATLLLLVVAMIIPQVANAVYVKPSKGDGTKESPYIIENYNNLSWFRNEVNKNGNGGICAKLTADIPQTLSYVDVIGTCEHPFWGEFDGNNKTIKGVNINTPVGLGPSPNYYEYAGGVFGCIKAPSGTTAVVKNLTVEGEVNIQVQNDVYYIGGVIGIAYGDVNLSNIISKVNVTVTNDASDAHCGGVVGSVEWFGNGNYSGNLTVSDCVNYGKINVACGEICGGVVGYIRNGSITDCLNVGNITNSEDGYTAGILGYVNSKGCTLSRCLNLGTVTNTKKSANAYAVYYKKDNIGSTSNLYYKTGVCGTALQATSVSEEEIKNGSVAYRLSDGSWGQSLGDNSVNDAYPYPNKTAYKVNLSDIGYYNSITSAIPTGDFTTTIETQSQYHYNQTRIGDTKNFNVTANAGKYTTKVKHNGITLTPTSVNNNVTTYSYTVALNNNFEITAADIVCATTLNQSTCTLSLTDNTLGSAETFTATPKPGHYITGATINGETIAGTDVSGKTDGTKSFSFIVKENNTVVINTAAISCTKTLNQSTTTLNLTDNTVGSTETFTVTPMAGNYVTNVIINGETVAGTAISGRTDGTKSFSFIVKESNTVSINTATIGYTKPTGAGFTTNLPDNLADKQIGSTVEFWVKFNDDICKADVTYNSSSLTPISTDTDGTRYYQFTVATENVISINATQHSYDTNGFCTICGSGHPATLDSDGYYNIADAGHLYWFAEKVNNGNTIINAKLTANIVLNEDVLTAEDTLNGDRTRFKIWTPIGNIRGYKGTFDGQGHTVSGLVFIDNTQPYIGLFSDNAPGGIIRNVGLIDSYFSALTYMGGICGRNEGTIENCFNAAKCTAVYFSGGIVGDNAGGVIANCYNIGVIDGGGGCSGICAMNVRTGSVATNNYYLKGTADNGIYSGSGEATEMTASQFASGEVAWLLNGSEAGESPAWRQTIGKDKYPVLDAKKGIVIYSTQTGLNPIIRPTAGTLVGAADVYNFAGIDGKKVYGIPQTGTLAAGHPYVFMSDYEYVSFVPSDEAVTDDTPTCGLTGVLDPAGVRVYGQNNTAGEDVSIVFTADALKYANPNGNTVKYGKCYINAGECFVTSGSVSAMARSIAFFGAGGTTGIDGTEAATDDHEGKAYNPQGVQVGKDYKGVVIVNGRKMVRK